jgi:hypothetical protein
MKTVCAWCSKDISPPGAEDDGGSVSYAICLPCANRVIIHTPLDIGTFFNDMAVPVVLVDGEGKVKCINDKTQALLGKDPDSVEGLPGGDVFQCVYARLPEGCGNTVHCSGCAIRRTVMETHATGRSLLRVPATLKQQSAHEELEVRFLISTEQFGDCVLLRIDKVE